MILDKTRIVYQGDIMTSYFYAGLGGILLICSGMLYAFTLRIGWFYLAMGLGLLGCFALGKAWYVRSKGSARLQYFNTLTRLEGDPLQKEVTYNSHRLEKKASNRRKYLYSLLIGCLMLVLGVVFHEKGLAIGSLVPVILFAGIEFTMGLLSEFRLWEYQRQLEKAINSNEEVEVEDM
ncbi:MAG: hypothetical protein IPN29_11725 [Saprospiraceae bacterium]|nr:hypothetical protein [Saprospiraceae bacterium]